jgi:serine/threonine-protein kinase
VPGGWSREGWQAALVDLGLVAEVYASFELALEIVVAGALAAAATVVVRREGAEPMGLLAALSLLLTALALLPVLAALPPSLHDLVRTLRAAAWVALLALLLLFPTGRFEPPWAGWLLALWAAYQVTAVAWPALAPPLALGRPASPAQWLVIGWHAAWLLLGLGLQARRLARAPSAPARQQTKWLLLGALTVAAGGLLLLLPHWLLPLERAPGLLGVVYTLLSPPLLGLLLLAWPASLSAAATRAGLWEVDYLANRALVYGPLLAVLGGLSGALLVALERLVPGEPVLTFAVTAVLAGLLYRPLRDGLEAWVDRRLFGLASDYRARPAGPGPELEHHALAGYTRLQPLGAGEFGRTFRALPPTPGPAVTLTVLPPALSADAGVRARFGPALAAACALEHPNLSRVYASGEAEGRLYVASETLVGQELSSFLLINGRLGLPRALPILAELARGLDALHAAGQAHGDVRLAHVMLVLREPEHLPRDARFPSRVAFLPSEAFRTVLLHVGLARAVESGLRGGGLPYLAPERLRGAPASAPADLYALGVLAYQMLAGMLPFASPSPTALAIAHLRQSPPDPRARVPGLSPLIAAGLMRAIAKDPGERFASAGEFVRALG